MINESWVKEKVKKNDFYISRHGDQERQNDDLALVEIVEALTNGRILEQYPDSGRGDSCLFVGFTNNGKPVHVVCGQRKDVLTVITVYIPMPPKFKTPYERG
jgi:Domain of unknown function (DUF4258)